MPANDVQDTNLVHHREDVQTLRGEWHCDGTAEGMQKEFARLQGAAAD